MTVCCFNELQHLLRLVFIYLSCHSILLWRIANNLNKYTLTHLLWQICHLSSTMTSCKNVLFALLIIFQFVKNFKEHTVSTRYCNRAKKSGFLCFEVDKLQNKTEKSVQWMWTKCVNCFKNFNKLKMSLRHWLSPTNCFCNEYRPLKSLKVWVL